jgi:integrase
MPARVPQAQKYRHYKPKDLAVVRIDGKDIYLGKYGSPESRERYGRLIAEWFATGRVEPTKPLPMAQQPPAPLTIAELILAYWKHAETYYRTREGKPTQEQDNLRVALRPLRKLYGRTPARDFGPLALQAVRQDMIRSGLCRTTINARANRIRRVFKWAVSVEMIPASVTHALRDVDGLSEGRSEAREADAVEPVPIGVVEATLPHLPRPVAAMVRLQLLTGCRAGEVMAMRGCDLTPGDPTWEYRPAHHKNEWRGQELTFPTDSGRGLGIM